MFSYRTHKDTIGMVEVGGGSMQIAFIPERPIYAGKQAVIIGGREYDVYAHSFLSYGAKSIGMRIEEYLVRQNMQAVVLTNPCMLKGIHKKTYVKFILNSLQVITNELYGRL